EGGLTPSVGLMRAAAALPIPVFAMIRPRAGLFDASASEMKIMLEDIAAARNAGLSGVVLGVQDTDGGLHMAHLAALKHAAGELGTTLHRVIDVVPDPLKAIDQAAELGIDRVLTSGGAAQAVAGVNMIAQMVTRAAGRLSVMPGCGVTVVNVAEILLRTGAHEVHASCATPPSGDAAFSNFDPIGGRKETSETVVRAMTREINSSL
ncbi:MAG: copper homeostasis protein CutC, partial [Pseudoruegeria sp.]